MMPHGIPYEILVTSAARPHLLKPTLASLQSRVDQPPERILIHNDAVFTDFGPLGRVAHVVAGGLPGPTDLRWEDTKTAIRDAQEGQIVRPILVTHADPPRRLGMALKWLIGNVRTPYILYSQDDFVTVRTLPIIQALEVMEIHRLHQIRFNKRATMGQKDTWQGPWKKVEKRFIVLGEGETSYAVTCTVSDHWYFQTGLWRTSIIKAVLDWLTATPERTNVFAACPAEVAINKVMDGDFGLIPGLTVPYPHDALDPETRATIQRTFIWGPIGEDRYIRHIGTDARDQAGDHERGPLDAGETQRAWAEIASYDLAPCHCEPGQPCPRHTRKTP
jgi:hypothetical protein